MKIGIVPDVHGCPEWKAIKNFDCDKIVFLGDFFDNWELGFRGMKAAENFEEICAFVREDPENRKLLIGNHDYDNYLLRGKCSGFQSYYYATYKNLLLKNMDILDVVCEFDGYVFSHAGVSYAWMNLLNKFCEEKTEVFDLPIEEWNKKTDIEKINHIFHLGAEDSRYYFSFEDRDLSGFGESIFQTPLWIRPSSLLSSAWFKKQVVGHTEYCLDNFIALKGEDIDFLLLTDSFDHKVFGILDTENPPKTISSEEFRNFRNNVLLRLGKIKDLGLSNKTEIIKVLTSEFGEEKAERYYELISN